MHYIQNNHEQCERLIKEQLAETDHACEYALYVRGMIKRQKGKIQESLDCFQQCALMNSSNLNNLKQVAKSL